MSVLKTAGIFGAIGGVGLIGYYLLNKNKPTVDKQQTFDIKGEGYVLNTDNAENRKLWSIIAQYGYDNVDKRQEILNLKNKILTEKPLIITDAEHKTLFNFFGDMNNKNVFWEVYTGKKSTSSTKAWSNPYSLVVNQWDKRTKKIEDEKWRDIPYDFKPFSKECFENKNSAKCKEDYWQYATPEEYGFGFNIPPDPSGKNLYIRIKDCATLDGLIKRKQERIKQQIQRQPNPSRTKVLMWYKEIYEDYFELNACRDKIEKQRLLDSAKTQTLFAIRAEDSVLGASQKNQNIYLGAGALVLVLSTGLLLSTGKSTTPTSGSFKSSGILGNLVIVGGLAGMGYLIFKKPKVVLPNEDK
jgi:hypothetical protein